ncbi:DUF2066 domain-containing protein [Vibrio sp. 99-8-1]|uniref:DUF2066 domain-containing protein n=1 Tax=Vibrio sp. 99-8-1 TaxID=2607602 RepID=UPI001493CC09|nr:DUF2066 domain-containing protein [Vibrio sp. 99-8-1]NOI66633.1 DUF2066 domain-containing protein [Vibrio sp. 99-8-1]
MRHLAIFLMGLLVLPVYAAVKVDVYRTEVVLDENDVDTEKAAKAAGFQQVIIKASGDKNSASNPVVLKASRQSSQYLTQISYGEHLGGKTLKMLFNPPQIQSLLMQAELPFWSDVRSNLVVWIVEESQYQRAILWEQSGSSAMNQFKYFADLRGLPVTIPVGDIDDVVSITAPELWGGFVSPISMASQRYNGDAVLVVRIQQSASQSTIRWTLYDEKPAFMEESKRQPLSGFSRGETHVALEQVVDEVSNYYAEKSAVRNSGELTGTVDVQFINITSSNRFFTLEKLLKEKNSVASLSVQKVVGNEVTFTVNLLSSIEEFEAELLQSDNIEKFEIDTLPSVGSSIDVNSDVTQSGDMLVAEQGVDEVSVQPVQVDNNVSQPVVEETSMDVDSGLVNEDVTANKPIVFEWID